MKFTGVICLALVALAARSAAMTAPTPLPGYLLTPLAQQGAPIISAEVKKDRTAYEGALAKLQSSNTTCNTFVDSRKKPCGDCIKLKCKARVESVCKPEEWQVILGSIVTLATDGIPNFFSQSIPNFVINEIGANVIKVGEDIGKFFKDGVIGGITDGLGKGVNGIVDIGNTIGGGITGLGKDIGNGIVDLGKKIGDGVVGIGKGAIDGIKDIGSTIGGAFKDIFGGFGGIFGKRSLSRRRRSEPSCDDFEKDANKACLYYLKACSSCDISLDRDCPALAAASLEVKAATLQAAWLKRYAQPDFSIDSVTYDATSYDPATTGFKTVQVSVTFFGRKDTFMLNKPVQPFNPVQTGPAIARMALDRFKAATKL